LRSGGSMLRLAFSGRLVAMKGADHLALVADDLRRLGIAFSLDIFGDGDLRPKIESQIRRMQLERFVKLHGVLDFETELMPRVTRNVDLFVCCHPQGDPSCTYLETMSCGVPIAGYDNEAWAGLVRVAKAGWTSPMNNPKALAELIVRLNADRPALARAALASRDFAAGHLFEKTFSDRIAHLLSVRGQDSALCTSGTS
jgi:colanic acid/amylovoran biosynthesis glycosyltransferase